jgi:hypothetical protein
MSTCEKTRLERASEDACNTAVELVNATRLFRELREQLAEAAEVPPGGRAALVLRLGPLESRLSLDDTPDAYLEEVRNLLDGRLGGHIIRLWERLQTIASAGVQLCNDAQQAAADRAGAASRGCVTGEQAQETTP